MRIAIMLVCLVAVTLAYAPIDRTFQTRVNFGVPVTAAGFTLDNIKQTHPVTLACATAAWAGTAFVFGSIPWWDNPKVRPWTKAAAAVAVGGMFGVYASGLIR
jgi:hypothetical protein